MGDVLGRFLGLALLALAALSGGASAGTYTATFADVTFIDNAGRTSSVSGSFDYDDSRFQIVLRGSGTFAAAWDGFTSPISVPYQYPFIDQVYMDNGCSYPCKADAQVWLNTSSRVLPTLAFTRLTAATFISLARTTRRSTPPA
jgi:hypothetical protein